MAVNVSRTVQINTTIMIAQMNVYSVIQLVINALVI